jgi:hypothetical protein
MTNFGFEALGLGAISGGLTYLGVWNANTNNPFIQSGVGTPGDYYIVDVAGTTTIDGISDWGVGDWIIFSSTNVWQKIDNSDLEGYNLIQEEGVALPKQSIIDFQGAGVTATNGSGKTIVTIPGSGGGSSVYGSFYDTTTQTVASGQVKAIELNTTDISSGVIIANNLLARPTRITVNTTGVYNIQFSAQLNRLTGGNTKQIDIWLRVNELNVPWSTTGLNVQANANKLVAAWNFFVNLTATQYVELMWTQNDAIDILTSPATVDYPDTPSVILTINKVN